MKESDDEPLEVPTKLTLELIKQVLPEEALEGHFYFVTLIGSSVPKDLRDLFVVTPPTLHGGLESLRILIGVESGKWLDGRNVLWEAKSQFLILINNLYRSWLMLTQNWMMGVGFEP